MPIEASIEDLGFSEDLQEGSLQTDAGPITDNSLKSKLDQELSYHQYGSYSRQEPLAPASPQNPAPYAAPPWNAPEERGVPRQVSSVQSWYKNDPVRPAREEPAQPFDSYNTLSSSNYKATPVSPAHGGGTSPVSPYLMNRCPPFHRLYSNPANPTPESEAPDLTAGKYHLAAKLRSGDPGNSANVLTPPPGNSYQIAVTLIWKH